MIGIVVRAFGLSMLAGAATAIAGPQQGFVRAGLADFTDGQFVAFEGIPADFMLGDGSCVQFVVELDYVADTLTTAPSSFSSSLPFQVSDPNAVIFGTPEVATSPFLGSDFGLIPAIANPPVLSASTDCGATFNNALVGGRTKSFLPGLAADSDGSAASSQVATSFQNDTVIVDLTVSNIDGLFDPTADVSGALAVISVPLLKRSDRTTPLPTGPVMVLNFDTYEFTTDAMVEQFAFDFDSVNFASIGARDAFTRHGFEGTVGPETYTFTSDPMVDATGDFMDGQIVTGELTFSVPRPPGLGRVDVVPLIQSYRFQAADLVFDETNSVIKFARFGTDDEGNPFDLSFDFWLNPQPVASDDTVTGIQVFTDLVVGFSNGVVWKEGPCSPMGNDPCGTVDPSGGTSFGSFGLGDGFTVVAD